MNGKQLLVFWLTLFVCKGFLWPTYVSYPLLRHGGWYRLEQIGLAGLSLVVGAVLIWLLRDPKKK